MSTTTTIRGDRRDATTGHSTEQAEAAARSIESIGEFIARFGLVIVIGWIGVMKFTAYEAAGIEPMVRASPLMSWVYTMWSVQGFSNVLGVVEIAIAAMIALEATSPKIAVAGGTAAALMFATTSSFLVSTPGWEPSLGGFPALSVVPGQFLLKDLVLLGVSVQVLGRSLRRLG